MTQIRAVSDLRNKFPDIEKAVGGEEETALDEADRAAEDDERRLTHEKVFSNLQRRAD